MSSGPHEPIFSTRTLEVHITMNCLCCLYQKGDIVKQPMKKGSFVPKSVLGVGWGGSCRGGVGQARVGWGLSCRGGVRWVM